MRFLAALMLMAGTFAFAGCDNRTQEAQRWDQVAANLNSKENIQPWHEARSLWRSERYHEGIAW